MASVTATALRTSRAKHISTECGNQTKAWELKIDIGTQRQHVGPWSDHGQIGPDINGALRERCNKNKKPWGENCCSNKPWTWPVDYPDKTGRNAVLKNGLALNVTSDNIPEKYGRKLMNAFIDQILDTFMLAVQNQKNCYKSNRASTICIKCNFGFMGRLFTYERPMNLIWCNAPDFVRVAITDKDGNEKAHMQANLKYTQKPVNLGKFDCSSIVESVDKNAGDYRLQMLKVATNEQDFKPVVACASERVMGSCPNAECLYKLGKRGDKV